MNLHWSDAAQAGLRVERERPRHPFVQQILVTELVLDSYAFAVELFQQGLHDFAMCAEQRGRRRVEVQQRANVVRVSLGQQFTRFDGKPEKRSEWFEGLDAPFRRARQKPTWP